MYSQLIFNDRQQEAVGCDQRWCGGMVAAAASVKKCRRRRRQLAAINNRTVTPAGDATSSHVVHTAR